jgi:CheY-like chemotaxis protein
MPAARRIEPAGVPRKPTVLVAEDVPLVRMMVADFLRKAGFQVIEAGDGEEAKRVIEMGFPVQIVVSDVHMPGASMDGLDLARWTHRHRPDLKVILTSGVVTTLDPADERFHQGPLLQKPFKPEELERRVRSALADLPTGH